MSSNDLVALVRVFCDLGNSSIENLDACIERAMADLLDATGFQSIRFSIQSPISFWNNRALDVLRSNSPEPSSGPESQISVMAGKRRVGLIQAWGHGSGELLALASESLGRSLEYRLREQELRISEQRYRSYVELSNDCIWAADLDLNWHYISPSVLKLRGYTQEEAMKQGIFEMFTPESAQEALRILQKALDAIRKDPYIDYWPLLIECEETRKDGSNVWCEITASFTKGTDGRVNGIQGVTRDIDERKRVQLELIRRMDFENLISGLATNFINLPLEGLEGGILQTLEKIGEFLSADTAIVFSQNPEKRKHVLISHEWNRPDTPQHPHLWEALDLSSIPWLTEQLLSDGYAQIDDIAALAAQASAEQELFVRGEVASVAVMPIKLDTSGTGYLAVVKKSKASPWSPETRKLLEVAGQLLVNIYTRIKTETELDSHRKNLEALVKKRTAELMDTNLRLQAEVNSRVEAEQALRRSEARFRAIFESASDCISVWSSQFSLMYSNRAARNFEEYLGVGFIRDLFSSDVSAQGEIPAFFTRKVEQILETGRSLRETVTFDRENNPLVLDTAFSPIMGDQGEILAVVSLFRDITQKQMMEQELLRAKKIESIGVLAGGIAHDFNNLLTGIMLNLSLVKVKLAKMEEGSEVLPKVEAAERGAMRSRDLAGQLLTFARGGAPVKRVSSVDSIIRECAAFTVSGLNVKCEYEFDSELHPASIDPGQITQVLNNIIINAAQAMPQGGIVRIRAANVHLAPGDKDSSEESLLMEGDFLLVSVEDQGCGISPENLNRIFDPYFTTKGTGNGLGLALSYSIIRKHGGFIEVMSEPGQGTRFDIYLPAASKNDSVSGAVVNHQVVKGSGHILVMDDEEGIREALLEMLENLGYTAEGTSDGAALIEKFTLGLENGAPPDLIIMDLTIPGGIGGAEAMARISSILPGVRAIASSGYSNNPILSNYRDYGFVDIIPKPYEIVTLSQIVARSLRSGSEQAEVN